MTEDDRGKFDALTAGFEGCTDAKEAAAAIEEQRRYHEFLGRLDAEQLGRAVVIKQRGKASSSIKQADAGFELEHNDAPEQTELVGYILPLSPSEDAADPEHLILLRDGAMVAIQAISSPRDPIDSPINDRYRRAYKGQYSPNVNPIVFVHSSGSEVSDLLRRSSASRIVYDSNNAADEQRFPELLGNALTEARKLQEDRTARARSRIAGSNKMLSDFFKSTPGSQEPGSPPPQPQRPQ